jgi:hypothetical protein
MSGIHRLLASTATTVLLLGALAPVVTSVESVGPEESRLTGPRYATMRLLARYLDETAQGLLEGASDALLGTPSEGRFLASIRAFALSTRDFRGAIDGYQEAPFDVAPRLAALAEVSKAVEERLRTAGALERTYPEWKAVTEVLERMRSSLAGGEVEVPAAYIVPALSGAPLERFRELAAALEESAGGAHGKALKEIGNYQDRGRQFLGELQYFAALSRDLHARADATAVNPKAIGAIVDDLLKEARATDRRMRDAAVFKEVWTDSSRTITILQEMASLVRSSAEAGPPALPAEPGRLLP